MEEEGTGEAGKTGETVGEALAKAERVRFSELPEILWDKLMGWAKTGVAMLPNFVAALLVFILFWFIAKGVSNVARRGLDRVSGNRQVNDLLQVIVRTAVTAMGLFLALGILNLDGVVTSLLAGVGVVGLALGFAFQDIAANFMSGVIMAVARPFRVGDLVKTNDFFGTVEGIDLRITRLRTLTGELVLIPNQEVYNNPLVNFTETPDRRVDLSVGVSYGDDLRRAKQVVEDALKGLELTNRDRPVQVFYEEFGDSSINFQARFWIDFRKQGEYLEARSEAVMTIKEALDEAGITIPFPIRTLDFGAKAVGGEQLDGMLQPGLFSRDGTPAAGGGGEASDN